MNKEAVQHERGPRNSTIRRQVALYLKESAAVAAAMNHPVIHGIPPHLSLHGVNNGNSNNRSSTSPPPLPPPPPSLSSLPHHPLSAFHPHPGLSGHLPRPTPLLPPPSMNGRSSPRPSSLPTSPPTSTATSWTSLFSSTSGLSAAAAAAAAATYAGLYGGGGINPLLSFLSLPEFSRNLLLRSQGPYPSLPGYPFPPPFLLDGRNGTTGSSSDMRLPTTGPLGLLATAGGNHHRHQSFLEGKSGSTNSSDDRR